MLIAQPFEDLEEVVREANDTKYGLGFEVGPKTVARTAHRLGIASDLEPNASIALGTSEVTPLELVSAYAAFANGGIGVQPHVIQRVRTAEGKLVYQRRNANNGRVIEPQYVAMMNQMMEETLLTGTARKAELPGWQAAGKTGTSQDWRDAWFVGYTSYLVAGVWLGNDDGSPTKKVSGGNLPVEIWSRFMKEALQGVPPAGLPLGDWHGEEPPPPAPPAPTFSDPEVGAPLTINKSGAVGRAPLMCGLFDARGPAACRFAAGANSDAFASRRPRAWRRHPDPARIYSPTPAPPARPRGRQPAEQTVWRDVVPVANPLSRMRERVRGANPSRAMAKSTGWSEDEFAGACIFDNVFYHMLKRSAPCRPSSCPCPAMSPSRSALGQARSVQAAVNTASSTLTSVSRASRRSRKRCCPTWPPPASNSVASAMP